MLTCKFSHNNNIIFYIIQVNNVNMLLTKIYIWFWFWFFHYFTLDMETVSNHVLQHVWDKHHGLIIVSKYICDISSCSLGYMNLQSYRKAVKQIKYFKLLNSWMLVKMIEQEQELVSLWLIILIIEISHQLI